MKYILEMTPEHAQSLCNACEFYARMLMGQYKELIWQSMTISGDDYCERRDAAEEKLLEARDIILPELSHSFGHSYGVGHDKTADMAWELYEVVRYVKATTEHPEGGWTTDFSPPMSFSGEPLAKCQAVDSEVVAEYQQRTKGGFKPATSRTCEGDLILAINAMIDYADICDRKATEMEHGFEASSLRYYAERFRKIADKWAKAIGFDREKAIAICEKKKLHKKKDDDFGEDALMLSLKLAAEKGSGSR